MASPNPCSPCNTRVWPSNGWPRHSFSPVGVGDLHGTRLIEPSLEVAPTCFESAELQEGVAVIVTQGGAVVGEQGQLVGVDGVAQPPLPVSRYTQVAEGQRILRAQGEGPVQRFNRLRKATLLQLGDPHVDEGFHAVRIVLQRANAGVHAVLQPPRFDQHAGELRQGRCGLGIDPSGVAVGVGGVQEIALGRGGRSPDWPRVRTGLAASWSPV